MHYPDVPPLHPHHAATCHHCSVPQLAKRAHSFLKHEKGFSDMAIISGALLIPVLVGGLCICILDAAHQRYYAQNPPMLHQHYE